MDRIVSHIKLLRESPADGFMLFAVIFLPFSIIVTNVFMIGLIVWSVFKIPPATWVERIKRQRISLILMIAPFLFILISLAYTGDPKNGLHEIEKSLPLLLLPPVILVNTFKQPKSFFSEAFSIVILVMCMVCIAAGLYRFFFHELTADDPVGDRFTAIISPWNALTNSNLTLPFKINPIYFSLYVSFAMIVLAFSKHAAPIIKAFLFLLLLIFQILLGSRIGLAAIVASGFLSLFFIPPKSRRYLGWGLAACVLALTIFLAVNPILRKRYSSELVAWRFPEKMEDWNAVSLRNAVWSCSVKVFMESPVFGKGVGGADAGREECYKTYSFYGYFGTNFNSHNQFLEYAVTGGIILAGLFILQLCASCRAALKNRNTTYFLFLVTFAIVAFGESLLEAHKGIVFFTAFNSLFLFQNSIAQDNV